jgi:SAM-dependent methyltransferase
MTSSISFTYHDYEMRVIDQDAVETHLRGFVPYFSRCRHVLDIGPGNGTFLRLLREAGIPATGIENDPQLVEDMRQQGLTVLQGDAGAIWPAIGDAFDGVFCSHLIEHLAFQQVIGMIEGFAQRIQPGGVAVLAFPNPASLEMQLFHFWRDPQHVRFYHPQIVSELLAYYGFEIARLYTQGTWGEFAPHQPVGQASAAAAARMALRRLPLVRRLGRRAKDLLGITAVEVEADYMRKLRKVGREAVVVGRKRAQGDR